VFFTVSSGVCADPKYLKEKKSSMHRYFIRKLFLVEN